MAARLTRRVGFTALGALLLLIASAIGVNVYLNSRYLPGLVKSIQRGVSLEYRVAWSLWPGRIHLEGLKVRGEERSFSWALSADHAFIIADVSALTGRALELDTLALSGVEVKLRPRLDYLDASPDHLAHLPAIGPEDGTLLGEGPPLPPGLRRDRDPWSVLLRHVELEDLRSLWVDRFRFRGHAEAQGSLALSAGRMLESGTTTLRIDGGELSIDGRTTVRGLHGESTTRLGKVDLSTARGLQLLQPLSGEAKLQAEVVALDFLPQVTALPVPLEFQDARGPVSTQVEVSDGVVQPGAVLDWSAEAASARAAGFEIQGALALHAEVQEVEGQPRTRATATLEHYRLGRPGRPALSTGTKLRLSLDVPNVDLSRAAQFEGDLQQALAQWPAQLSVEGARLLGEERTLQWEAELKQLHSQVDLSALERRELHLMASRGDGVRVRLRPRLARAEATAAWLAQVPKIDGLGPPLRDEAPLVPLEQRAAENPWGIRVEDAQLENLEQVWLEAYRFDGHAKVSGGFHYEPGGRIGGGPFEFQLADGSLQIAKWRAATRIAGRITATVAPFDLEEPEGTEAFRFFSIGSDLTAQLDQVNFVRNYPAIPIPAELEGGQGPIRAQVSLKDGVVQAGSAVHWETRALQASTNGFRFIGPFAFDAKWADEDGDPRLHVHGRISPYRVTRVGEEKALVEGRLITWQMDAPPFDLARPRFEPLTAAQVHDGHVPDLRVVNDFVPKKLPLKVNAGDGTFTGRVWFTPRGQAWAEFKVGGAGAELAYDRIFVKGDWTCEARLKNVNLRTGAGEVERASLVVDDMAIREGSRARDGWFGRIEMKNGTVRPGEDVLLSGDVETTLRDGRPLIAFFAAETDLLPTWARSLVTLQALHGTGRFRLGMDRIEVDRLNARGQSLEIRGRLLKKGLLQMGDLLVLAQGQEVGVALRGKRVELKLIGASAWYREQLLNPKW